MWKEKSGSPGPNRAIRPTAGRDLFLSFEQVFIKSHSIPEQPRIHLSMRVPGSFGHYVQLCVTLGSSLRPRGIYSYHHWNMGIIILWGAFWSFSLSISESNMFLAAATWCLSEYCPSTPGLQPQQLVEASHPPGASCFQLGQRDPSPCEFW